MVVSVADNNRGSSLLISVGTDTTLLIVIVTIEVRIVGECAVFSAERSTTTLILEVPIETWERTMSKASISTVQRQHASFADRLLCAFMLQKQLTLFDAKVTQITRRKQRSHGKIVFKRSNNLLQMWTFFYQTQLLEIIGHQWVLFYMYSGGKRRKVCFFGLIKEKARPTLLTWYVLRTDQMRKENVLSFVLFLSTLFSCCCFYLFTIDSQVMETFHWLDRLEPMAGHVRQRTLVIARS